MLKELYELQNLTNTENGAPAFRSTGSACLDLFSCIGSLRGADEKRILTLFRRAFVENPTYAMRILFYARDIRGGLGERRVFRICFKELAMRYPKLTAEFLYLFPEFGRYDDLLELLDTPCRDFVIDFLKAQLDDDIEKMSQGKPVTLLAKWLPSVNTSSSLSKFRAKLLCKSWKMPEKTYRKTLSALREKIDILERHLCERDYTFEYSALPGKAMLKHFNAFRRHDSVRFEKYLESVSDGQAQMHMSTVYPYEIIHPIADDESPCDFDAKALDEAWRALPNYCDGRNAIAVVDGSGSMYRSSRPYKPIDVAISLGIYFAERNTGFFHNHFITFSESPRLVKIPDSSIAVKAQYCMSYCEVSNTNLLNVFMLILRAAVRNKLPQSELPEVIYIISDMEFDFAVGSDLTVYETARRMYEEYGYKLPAVVFWNVESRHNQVPVTKNEQGTVLVSGLSPSVFKFAVSGSSTPEEFMLTVINSPRYAVINVEHRL